MLGDGSFVRYGICVYRNGAKYEGEFNSNVRSGQGVIQFANGDVYEGEWSKDCIHGIVTDLVQHFVLYTFQAPVG